MKTILYYLSLLIFIILIAGFLLFGGTMDMGQIVGVSAALVLYTIVMSLVGEGAHQDEREILHKNLSNRAGMIAGIVVMSIGVIIELFMHHIDYWLLGGLVVINVVKIVSLIYLNSNK